MFTDGLDPSALQWVREGVQVKERPVSSSSTFTDTHSTYLGRENVSVGRKLGKGRWGGLPPSQLQSGHFQSGLIRPQFSSAVDDSNESVGSASADNQEYEDSSDSEEQNSGRYSLDSSPRNASLEPNEANYDKAACGAAHEYYYEYDRRLLSSRSNSRSNSICNSGRESSGRLEGRQAQAWQKVRPNHESPYQYEGDSSTVCNQGERNRCWSDGETLGNVGKVDIDCGDVEEAIMRSQRSTNYERSKHNLGRGENADETALSDRARLQIMSDEMGVPPSAPPMVGSSGIESSKYENYASNPDRLDQSFSKNSERYSSFSRVSKASASCTFENKQGSYEGDQLSEACTRREENASSNRQTPSASQPTQNQLSAHAAWPTVIAYEACVRLCLRAWARGCVEATEFLHNECSVLQNSFGLKHVLLQPQEDASQRSSVEAPETLTDSKLSKDSGKLRVQVRKVKLTLKTSSGCSFRSLDVSSAGLDLNVKPAILSGWDNIKQQCVFPRQISRSTSLSGAGYMQVGAQYMRQVSGLLKAGVSTLRSSALMDAPQEIYTCVLRLKSMAEDSVRMQPGSGDSHIFHPENSGDDLILEVQDSKGSFLGRGLVHLVSISDDQNDRVRWWSVRDERDQECIGKVQLFINYTISSNSARLNKLGVVGETLAYDTVLDSAMRMQKFQQKNLRLHGSWKWLLSEFASYYGVSDAYTKLRYLSCVMEVATPTEDCLLLIHDLLSPIVSAQHEVLLNRQEKRILLDVQDQVEQLLALLFENYKSLDETSPSGMTKVLTPVAGNAAPALVPAVQLYTLLHDVLSLEAQTVLHNYIQAAAKKRCRRHMAETDEFVSSNNEGFLLDTLTISSAYSKMKALCINLSKEVQTDIEIHNQHILPSSIDLPNITAGIYGVELCNRLRTFLVACPPSSPSPPVTELLLATADFQRNLGCWNISPIKGGVDAKDLFHLYIVLWIQDKRLNLLDFCKLDKVRWTVVTTQHGTSPFVEEMYDRIRETLKEYEVLLNRWPEYAFPLENAVADVETATIAALEKQYADVLNPLKEVMVPKKFSLQYMQKLTRRRSLTIYSVPNQLGIFLNTIKRSLDNLRPKIEYQMKSWVACLPAEGSEKAGFGERLNEVTVILRAKYKNFLQAIVEKLVDNACMQRATKLKKILQDTREAGGESEIRDQMQLLSLQLMDTISHLHDVFSSRVFVAICRGYWDRMGQDILHFLENRKENRSWYKGSYFALAILDDLFASQMQKLQGHDLQEKDLEPPRSVMEARSMLSKDAQIGPDDSNYLYF